MTSHTSDKSIRLGLCCLNLELKEGKPPIYPSRTITQDGVRKNGLAELQKRTLDNLADVEKMILWNEEHNIRVFRLSSNLFPQYTNPAIPEILRRRGDGPYNMNFAMESLHRIGKLARKYGHRLTFHPSQYNVLATPHDVALASTIADLTHHADMLDAMGCDRNSIMVVHGGGTYEDKPAATSRWCKRYKALPHRVRKRLVLENDERDYSIEDCLEIHRRVGIPLCFDLFHHFCYIKAHPDANLQPAEYYLPTVLDSWKRAKIRPKFHISEQGGGKLGHHSDYVNVIPDYMFDIPDRYGIKIDIMIEAKKKEKAIARLYKKYPHLCQT